MKNLMIFIIAIQLLYAHSLYANSPFPLQKSSDCHRKEVVTKPVNNFIFSGRYCVSSLEVRNSIDLNQLPNFHDAYEVANRYRFAYQSIESHELRAQFVDAFLVVASKRLSLSSKEKDGVHRVKVVINSKSHSGNHISGITLNIIEKEVIEKLNEINAHVHSPISSNLTITELIHYIFENSDKAKKPVKTKLNSTIMMAPIDGGNPCDLDCEYRDWVEDQIVGGGYNDFYWDTRVVQGTTEEFIVYEDEYGVEHEAYHFNPSGP